MKTFSMFNMGYEVSSNGAKLSSALLPRIKNDRSLTLASGVRYMEVPPLVTQCIFPTGVFLFFGDLGEMRS